MPTLEEVNKNLSKKGFVPSQPKKIKRANKTRVFNLETGIDENTATSPIPEQFRDESSKLNHVDTSCSQKESDLEVILEPVPKIEPVQNEKPVPEKEPVQETKPVSRFEPVQEIKQVPNVEPVQKEKLVLEIKRPDLSLVEPVIINTEIVTSKPLLKLRLFFLENLNFNDFSPFGLDTICEAANISKGAIRKGVNELVRLGVLEHKTGQAFDKRGVKQENMNLYKLK